MQSDNTTPEPTVNPAPATTAQPASGATWPGAFGLFKFSKAAVKFNGTAFAVLFLLNLFVGVLPNLYRGDSAGVSFLVQLILFVVSAILTIAFTLVLLAGARRTKMSFSESFSTTTAMLVLRLVGVYIITGVLTLLSLLLFIIPFFFVWPRLYMAYVYVIDENMGVFDAISASWNKSKGNVGKFYGIAGAYLVFALPMLTIIGIPVSIYLFIMYSAAFVLLYQFINGESLAPLDAPATAPAQPATPAE